MIAAPIHISIIVLHVCNSLAALVGCEFGMRALLLMTAIVLAIIPAASDAASHHRTVTRSRPKSRTKRRHSRHRRRAAPRYQLHPTASRYKRIQQALEEKGYYHGKIDGKWGPDSISALERFQTEQGIENEGKITALALIGLGLGPKHSHAIVPSPEEANREFD
jgi:hypothetical protein